MARKTAPNEPELPTTPATNDGPDQAAEPLPNQVPNALVRLIIQTYEDQQGDMMGNLHNRFVAYISQSGVSLAGTIVVLELLLDEARKLARERYIKSE